MDMPNSNNITGAGRNGQAFNPATSFTTRSVFRLLRVVVNTNPQERLLP